MPGPDSGASRTRRSRGGRLRAALPTGVAIVAGATIGALIVAGGREGAPPAAVASVSTGPMVSDATGRPPEVAAGEEPAADLGSLGPVDTPALLRQAVRTAQRRGPVPHGPSEPLTLPTCARVLPQAVGLVVAGTYATGSVAGAPVTVLVGVAADGAPVAVVLESPDCVLRLRTRLGEP